VRRQFRAGAAGVHASVGHGGDERLSENRIAGLVQGVRPKDAEDGWAFLAQFCGESRRRRKWERNNAASFCLSGPGSF